MYIHHLEQHIVWEEIYQNANSYLWMLKIHVTYFYLSLVFFSKHPNVSSKIIYCFYNQKKIFWDTWQDFSLNKQTSALVIGYESDMCGFYWSQKSVFLFYLALKYFCKNGNILLEQGQEYTFVWSLDPNCPGLLQAL